jgi:hypothetical protein
MILFLHLFLFLHFHPHFFPFIDSSQATAGSPIWLGRERSVTVGVRGAEPCGRRFVGGHVDRAGCASDGPCQ